jgi:drug/metabolite transporter (DMT)-like permease
MRATSCLDKTPLNEAVPWLYASVMVLFLTAGWVLAGSLVAHVPPLAVAGGRTLSSCLVITIVAAATPATRRQVAISIRRVVAVVGLAFVGFFLYYAGTLLGTARLGAAESGLVVSLLPCFTFLLGVIAGRETPTVIKIGGTALATTAAIVYAVAGGNTTSGTHHGPPVIGLLLVAGGTVAYASYGYLYRGTMADLNPFAALPAITAVGSLMLLPFAAAVSGLGHISLADWGGVALLGAGLTAPVFVIAHELIRRKGPLFAASFALVVPFTIRLSEWMLGKSEGPGPMTIMLLIISAAGVWATIAKPSMGKVWPPATAIDPAPIENS